MARPLRRCPVAEIASVFTRARIPFHQITGMLHDDHAVWDEVDAWIEAARVAHVMAHNRLGRWAILAAACSIFITELTGTAPPLAATWKSSRWTNSPLCGGKSPAGKVKRGSPNSGGLYVQPDCAPDELDRAARTSVALDRLVANTILARSPIITWAPATPRTRSHLSSIILGNSLLTARGMPVAGEYEIKNAQAMKIMDCLPRRRFLFPILRDGF